MDNNNVNKMIFMSTVLDDELQAPLLFLASYRKFEKYWLDDGRLNMSYVTSCLLNEESPGPLMF